MDFKYIIQPLLGAVIGAFTNWLAIKMLFRPYTEKKIFGFRVPFTPGLIPKERERLAESIGETVSEHLLTKETLVNAITSEEFSKNFNKIFDDSFERIVKNDFTIEEILNTTLKQNKERYLENSKNYIFNQIEKSIIDNKNEILNFVFEKTILYLKETNTYEFSSKITNKMKNSISKYEEVFFKSEKYEEFLLGIINTTQEKIESKDYKLNQIVPQKVLIVSKDFIDNNISKVPEIIEKFLNDNEKLEERLQKLIKDIINDNVGKLIGAFFNDEKVYNNIKKGMLDYLGDKDNQVYFSAYIFEYLNIQLDRNLNEIYDSIDEETKENIKYKTIEFFKNNINNKLLEGIVDFIEKKAEEKKDLSFYEVLKDIYPEFEEKLYVIFKKNIDKLLDFIVQQINNNKEEVIKKILDFKINTILNKVSEESFIKFKNFSINILKKIVEVGANYLAENLDISKIANERINSLDMAEMENIIVSVVNKELNAITYLGGLLGLVIGAIPLLFN